MAVLGLLPPADEGVKRMKRHCPRCESLVTVRTSCEISNLTRESYYACSTTTRWHVFAAIIVMSLVQSARLNGHEPWAYLRDVLQRLPTQRSSQIEDLLPHRWQPASDAAP
jgi:hypothetical protein